MHDQLGYVNNRFNHPEGEESAVAGNLGADIQCVQYRTNLDVRAMPGGLGTRG